MKWRLLLNIKRKDFTLRIAIICGALLIAGCAITLVVYFAHNSTLEARQQELISRVHTTVFNNLQREIDRNLEALATIKTAFLAQGQLSRNEFKIYTNHYLQQINSIQALEWVPHILSNQLDSLERVTRQEGFADFQLFTRIGTQIQKVEKRTEYFPVYYIEPFEENKEAFGFDPGPAGKERYAAVQEAIESGETAASDLMNLIQNKNEQHAVLVFVPIYKDELNPMAAHAVHSLVEGVYLVDTLIAAALVNYKIPSPLVVELKEYANAQKLLFTNAINQSNSTDKVHAFTNSLKMANKNWQLVTFNPGPNPFAVINPYWILIIGFSLTTLVAINVFRFLTDNRKELRAYSKQLEIKNKELEQYAYVAAHDLQEPLHTISSLISLVKDDYETRLDDQGKTYLHLIRDASDRMKSLILDLLNYSRLGSSERPELIDCNVLMKQVIADMNQLIQERNATVQVEKLPTLLGYPTALRQLFLNLVINGIKFQPAGQVPIVTVRANQRENSGWLFAVQDNGIGIPAAQHESVFALFKRLHIRDKYSGNGIGLTYCKKAVEMHHGEIWIESEPGKGSTFKFFLNL